MSRVPRGDVTLRQGKLGVAAIACLVISAAAPLTVTASAAPTAFRLGGLGAPLAMVLCAGVLVLFALGFTAMSSHVTNAAAFYAYVGQGLGKPAGVGVAAVTTFAYVVLTASFYGFIGFFTSEAFESLLGLSVHWAVGAVSAWVIVMVLGMRSVEAGAQVLIVLVALELLVLLIVSIAVLVNADPADISFASFDPSLLAGPGVAALFVLGFGAFVGFEGTAIYAEEARRPKRTVPMATFLAVGFLGVFYGATFWIFTVALGTTGVLEAAAEDDFQDMLFAIASTHVGAWMGGLLLVLVVTSFLACLLAFHNASARYVFALGRDGALPHALGIVHPSRGAPTRASLAVSLVSVLPIIVCAILGRDPFLEFALFGYAIGVAAVIFAQAAAAIAVFAYFSRDRRGHHILRVIVAPGVTAAAMVIAWVLIALNFEIVSGVEGPVNWLLLAPTPILLITGISAALWWRRSNPARYARLAEGVDAPADEEEAAHGGYEVTPHRGHH